MAFLYLGKLYNHCLVIIIYVLLSSYPVMSLLAAAAKSMSTIRKSSRAANCPWHFDVDKVTNKIYLLRDKDPSLGRHFGAVKTITYSDDFSPDCIIVSACLAIMATMHGIVIIN